MSYGKYNYSVYTDFLIKRKGFTSKFIFNSKVRSIFLDGPQNILNFYMFGFRIDFQVNRFQNIIEYLNHVHSSTEHFY